ERHRRDLLRQVHARLPGLHAVRAVHPGLPDRRDRHDAGPGPVGPDARRSLPEQGAAHGERARAPRGARSGLGGHRHAPARVDRCGARSRAARGGAGPVRDLAFWALAVLVLGGGVAVVSARSLFRAAFALAATLLATAGLYALLRERGRRAPRRRDPSRG